MDSEHPSSIALQNAASLGVDLPFSGERSRGKRPALSGAQLADAKERDPRLEEEARIARQIAEGIREGDSDAETAMVERYSTGLRYLLLRRIGDEDRARDLLQDTFVIAIAKLREINIENPERLAGYLRGIAIRVAMNAGRRKQREPHSMEVDAINSIPDREPRQFEHIAREQTQNAVHRMLRSLPRKRDREILTRFYVQDQDKDEICEALGLDSLHFNRVLFRAKKRFRAILEKSVTIADFVPDNT